MVHGVCLASDALEQEAPHCYGEIQGCYFLVNNIWSKKRVTVEKVEQSTSGRYWL